MKAPGYDLIGGKILKELPDAIITYIKNLFNGILRLQYFPITWKVGQIKAIPKPNKNANTVSSYRPISLLSAPSKVFEKVLFNRIEPILKQKNIIPPHQFGFLKQHSTIQQVNRVTISTKRSFAMLCTWTLLKQLTKYGTKDCRIR